MANQTATIIVSMRQLYHNKIKGLDLGVDKLLLLFIPGRTSFVNLIANHEVSTTHTSAGFGSSASEIGTWNSLFSPAVTLAKKLKVAPLIFAHHTNNDQFPKPLPAQVNSSVSVSHSYFVSLVKSKIVVNVMALSAKTKKVFSDSSVLFSLNERPLYVPSTPHLFTWLHAMFTKFWVPKTTTQPTMNTRVTNPIPQPQVTLFVLTFRKFHSLTVTWLKVSDHFINMCPRLFVNSFGHGLFSELLVV